MASIKCSTDAKGHVKYYVHWKDEKSGHGRRRIFKNIDEAVHVFWLRENETYHRRTVETISKRRQWTVEKLLFFFLGAQCEKLDRNVIRASTYEKCRYDILAITGPVLKRSISSVSQHELSVHIQPGAYRWLFAAFNLLVDKGFISASPLDKPAHRWRKPIEIPSKSSIRQLLSTAPHRERIACWLGICGLRIGEVLALTYVDVSQNWIHVRRRIIDGVVHDGLKSGTERRMKMPGELFTLLDKELIGSRSPVIAHHFTGKELSINYGTQGPLRKVLAQHGIRRFHHLRHFAVSRLADRGVDILKISRLIGHSNIKTTMDVYGHLFGETIDLDLD
ncbi:TPA: site-specific integrase [Enterobacter ludwigii]|nr:site-specific integrase [Enterobacter ludwigii]HDR2600129.1 site-specific integrase [Enterobacter ludwigii]